MVKVSKAVFLLAAVLTAKRIYKKQKCGGTNAI